MGGNIGPCLSTDNLKSIHVYALDRCKYAMMKFEHIWIDIIKIYF